MEVHLPINILIMYLSFYLLIVVGTAVGYTAPIVLLIILLGLYLRELLLIELI